MYGRRPRQGIVTAARSEQYRALFGNDDGQAISDTLSKLDTATAFDSIFRARLGDVANVRPELADLVGSIEFATVESGEEIIKSLVLPDRSSLVVLDMATTTFIWMMNKSFAYGQAYLSNDENRSLYAQIFLHFATRLTMSDYFVFPRPKTPPHQAEEDFYLVALLTEIQERFLLYHEFAHLVPEARRPATRVHQSEYLLKTSMDLTFLPSAEDEALADEIAFDILLDYYGREQREVVESVCTAVFLLIRYFMWFRLVYKQGEQDPEFHTWIRRNSFFREKFRHVFRQWGEPLFIVELMESHLEPAMECGALMAREAFVEMKAELDRRKTTPPK